MDPYKSKIVLMAIEDGIFDCLMDPYDQLGNGDPISSMPIDLERFARKIIEECIDVAEETVSNHEGVTFGLGDDVRKHFNIYEDSSTTSRE